MFLRVHALTTGEMYTEVGCLLACSAAPRSLVEVYQCFHRLHGATTQKTAILVLTAEETRNLTEMYTFSAAEVLAIC
jgi:hypothetical protein